MSAARYDVAVIGSGAGGAVQAYALARRGLSVVVIERGKREDPTTFAHDEAVQFPRLYKHGGLQTTVDRNLVIAQGATVGGSTVINNAIWLRADLDYVLPRWEQAGARVERSDLETAYATLEKWLHVEPLPPRRANHGTDPFINGARALGLEAGLLDHNRNTCIACGWCNYGCKYNRKTSALVTFIPWAEQRGARILDRCLEARILTRGDRATGVRFVREGRVEEVEAERVVVAAGAIGSSAVLLQSGIALDGRVGEGFHAFAGVHVTAEFADPLDSFDGIGLCAYVKPGLSEEYVLENYFSPPGVFSLVVGGWFTDHFERMLRYRYFAQAGVQVPTVPSGRIRLGRKGDVQIRFSLSAHELEVIRQGIKALGEIFFAGGAIRVLPATYGRIEFARREELDLLGKLCPGPDDLSLGSAHPQGGNLMHADPRRGVVGLDHKVKGFQNLFVSDSSVFPVNIRANCQATVMAMSLRASEYVAR
jgi:choline dehydrogenase-like flavoprotein